MSNSAPVSPTRSNSEVMSSITSLFDNVHNKYITSKSNKPLLSSLNSSKYMAQAAPKRKPRFRSIIGTTNLSASLTHPFGDTRANNKDTFFDLSPRPNLKSMMTSTENDNGYVNFFHRKCYEGETNLRLLSEQHHYRHPPLGKFLASEESPRNKCNFESFHTTQPLTRRKILRVQEPSKTIHEERTTRTRSDRRTQRSCKSQTWKADRSSLIRPVPSFDAVHPDKHSALSCTGKEQFLTEYQSRFALGNERIRSPEQQRKHLERLRYDIKLKRRRQNEERVLEAYRQEEQEKAEHDRRRTLGRRKQRLRYQKAMMDEEEFRNKPGTFTREMHNIVLDQRARIAELERRTDLENTLLPPLSARHSPNHRRSPRTQPRSV